MALSEVSVLSGVLGLPVVLGMPGKRGGSEGVHGSASQGPCLVSAVCDWRGLSGVPNISHCDSGGGGGMGMGET